MGWACGTCGERRGVLCWEHPKEGYNLKELVVDGRIMLEWPLKE